MRAGRHFARASILTMLCASWARAELQVHFEIHLERQGFPDFDVNPVITGAEGTEHLFTANMVISSESSGHGFDSPIQGWSWGAWNAGLQIVSISVEGTASADKSAGGYFDGGFFVYQVINPLKNHGKHGVVQAIVLGWFNPATLPPNTSQVVGRHVYRARVPGDGVRAFIGYENSLIGRGQPVSNDVTAGNSTVHPTLDRREIRVGQEVPLEAPACDDGIDNDHDGWTDCSDPECRGQEGCEPESSCDDGIDNDGDGAVDCVDFDCRLRGGCIEICDDRADNDGDALADCDDPECAPFAHCRPPEVCDDGTDNNGDGIVDCTDPDCYGVGTCPGPEDCGNNADDNGDGRADCEDPQCEGNDLCQDFEVCGDAQDNNRDGLIDCKDPQCVHTYICIGFETCGDGIDNNGDGRIDCDDPQCKRLPICKKPEICGDGLDNDGDGRIDCDDPVCAGRPPCPSPEVCGDGADNDQDGKTDCDDPQCTGIPPCPGPEQCGDRIDNDQDGKIDCADSDCAGSISCPAREVCDDRIDNDRDLRVDCDDPDCAAEPSCSGREVCDDGADNDGDLQVDCNDLDCRRSPACAGREVCDDAIDNDSNGLVDCADPDCAAAPLCAEGSGGFDYVLTGEGSRFAGNRSVVDVDPIEDAKVPVTVYIVPYPEPQRSGVQGWSLSIAHDKGALGFDPDGGAPTTAGTDASDVFSGGFQKTEVGRDRPPAGRGGGAQEDETDGFVSAMVLSFTSPAELDPTRAQSVARARYVVAADLGSAEVPAAAVRFTDGLRGSGQPVQNAFTVEGATQKPVHLIDLEVRRATLSAPFVRGDANQDRKINLADAVWCVNELLRRGPRSPCPRASDVNSDRSYDLADAVFLIHWEFLSGPAIPPPFPDCGVAAGSRELGCPEGAVEYCR